MEKIESNVFDIRSGQTILPKKIRSILKGQYLESKEMDRTPDDFVTALEQRFLGEMAVSMVEITKKMFEKGVNNGK